MTSISVSANLHRRPARSAAEARDTNESRFVAPFRRRRRTPGSLREQILSDPLYIRHQII